MISIRAIASAVVLLGLLSGQAAADPLPSWNDGASRSAIIAFVESVTAASSAAYVPAAAPIAAAMVACA